MDKERLEKLILGCKPAVMKAKIRIVRKLIKKMNILKKCKDPALKEKKLKKASRVLEEIIIINRLKVFDVVSFALKTKSLEEALKTPSNERLHACAVVAKFKDVSDQVQKLRKKCKDEAELISMLDSLEEERKNKVRRKAIRRKVEESVTKPAKKKKKPAVKANLEKESVVANGEAKNKNKKKGKVKKLGNKSETSENKPKPSETKAQVEKMKNIERGVDEENNEIKIIQVQCENREDSKVSSVNLNEEKINDPFFVGKKVIKPKFVNPEDEDKVNFENEDSTPFENSNLKQRTKDSMWKMSDSKEPRDSVSKNFSNKKPEKRKSGPQKSAPKAEDLHPSWAAKKSVQPIIQPFQGKKIKFDD